MTTATQQAATTWNVTNEEYHGTPNVWGSSQIRDFLRDPASFAARHVLYTAPRKSSGAMDVGSAFDLALLSPDEFDACVMLGPTKTRGKAWEEAQAANPGMYLINEEERANIELMAAAVYANPVARDLLGQREGMIYNHRMRWTDPITGLECKAEHDLSQTKAQWVANVKTTDRRSGRVGTYPSAWRHSMRQFGYWTQTAHHLTGAQLWHGAEYVPHYHIVVDKCPRRESLHESCAVYLTNNPESETAMEEMAKAHDACTRALEGIKHGLDTNDWPSKLYQIQSL